MLDTEGYMIKLKQLTDNSWLVLDSATCDKIGILSQSYQGDFIIMSNGVKTKFSSEEELSKAFGVNVFDDVDAVSETTLSEYFVGGHPVDSVCEVVDNDLGLPLFKRNTRGAVFAAGYYCIKYPKQTLSAHCPRYDTLLKHGFSGPFSNKYDVKSELSRMRKNEQLR